jgi:hypothetical protein
VNATPARKKTPAAKPADARKKPAPPEKKAPTAKAAVTKKKAPPARMKPTPPKKKAVAPAPEVEAAARTPERAAAAAVAEKEALAKRPPAKKPAERPVVKVHRPKAKMGPDGILILEEDKILQKAYYAGQQMHSPMGGFLQLLGVRSRDDGSAIALLECSASSLRYLLELAKATRGERSQVRAVQNRGEDPDCPRHGTGVRLFRAGKDLVCPLCGIAYGRV